MKPPLTQLFDPHLFVFKTFGLWPGEQTFRDFSRLLFAFCFTILGYICLLLLSTLFVDSIEQILNNLIVITSLIIVYVKGLIFYYNQSEFLHALDLLVVLERKFCRNIRSESSKIRKACALGRTLFLSFSFCYASVWISWAIQTIQTSFEDQTSTSNGTAIDQYKTISAFLFKAYALSVVVIFLTIFETFGIIKNIILSAHIDLLSDRLCRIGNNQDTSDFVTRTSFDASDSLEKCIKMHIMCLR